MKTLAQTLLTILTLLMGAGLASADSRVIARATVPFAFGVPGTDLPPGQYQLLLEDPTYGTLILRNLADGKATLVPFASRLAVRSRDGVSALVFDEARGKCYLSEVDISGNNRYLIDEEGGVHTRVVFRASTDRVGPGRLLSSGFVGD